MQLAIGTDVKNAYENKVHIQMNKYYWAHSLKSIVIRTYILMIKYHQEQIQKNLAFCDQSELLTKRLDAA